MSLSGRVKSALKPPSTNYDLGAARSPLDLLPAGAVVVDIGAGATAGSYAFVRRGARRPDECRYLTLDIEGGPGVAVRGDARAIPLASGCADCVICVSVLEYVSDPFAVAAEIRRVLRPGGIVYVSVPFVFPHHPPPADLWRLSIDGLRVLFRDFEEVQTGYNRGPASTFCQILVHFLATCGSGNSRRAYGLLLEVAQWMFFWVKYLDRWIGRYATVATLYSGAFLLGRKPLTGGTSSPLADAGIAPCQT